ncbi:hypothetical protein IV73_GL001003 [Weissella kandleri]|uniref:DNA-directed DNA polymerase n=1 Tax=Weissella kandleri TaxID=1616 RepID=A0A0R2JC43_9LACO|nr:DNA polymerase III subunit gamma/tau [Weissella kandleri]KRN74880.1 hypothetical protein IV73_GL001003 [Weissella kandleri]
MAYQALYRTWRPQKFADMVGQEVVTKTLQNALRTQQISHAYLFTGPRGTGKTSAAKIFAKTVNCLHPVDGEADGTCEVCQAIDQGTLGDIIELDAASNNGVDEIREIREDVNYAPTLAKYKVYIIDEVHMLSTGAFNALLKTLEEPPANVIFILATTEPQKIPATIISRTQRFDFRRISASEAYERIVYILQQRGNEYDEKALKVIANAADGGMRDALSILDQALSFGDGQVTLDNALLVTGSVTQTLLGDYLKAVATHQTDHALAELTKVLAEGKDANRFIEDLISYARDLLIAHEAPDLVNLVPDDNFNELLQKEEQLWYQMIDTLNEVQQQLRFTNRPSIYLEVLTVKLSRLELLTQVEAQAVQTTPANQSAEEPAQPVEKSVMLEKTVTPTKSNSTSTRDKSNVKKASIDKRHVFAVLDAATRGDLNRMEGVWADVLAQLEVTKKAMLNTAKPLAASPDGMVVGFDFEIFRDKTFRDETLIQFLMEQIQTLSGSEHERALVLITNEEWSDLRSTWVQQHHVKQSKADVEQAAQPAPEENAIDLPEDEAPAPVVQKAREMFGADLVEVHAD